MMPRVPATKDDFVVLQTIGEGTFGRCQKVRRRKDDKVFVWKEISYSGMSEGEKVQLVREVNLLREFKHPHIVRYHDRIIDKTRSVLYIVMEYCEGGDLATVITTHRSNRQFVDESFVWKVLHQLLLALQECHQHKMQGEKVLHRDIKPANVFLDSEKNVKLGDFGLARILHDTSLAKTFVGTPYYMSPEQLCHSSYDQHSDMWSLGCLLYELCALSPPFTAATQQWLTTKVCEGKFRRIPSQYSDRLNGIISCLLHTTPSRRPSVEELLVKITANSDSSSDLESVLVKREAAVAQREHDVQLREAAVLAKEKHLAAWEQSLRQRATPLSQIQPSAAAAAVCKEYT